MTNRDLGIDLREMIVEYSFLRWCEKINKCQDKILDPKTEDTLFSEIMETDRARRYYKKAKERLHTQFEPDE